MWCVVSLSSPLLPTGSWRLKTAFVHLTCSMLRTFSLLIALIAPAAAQVAAPANPPTNPAATTSPVVSQTLSSLSRTAENTRVDLAGLRINRWKGNSAAKQDASERVQSIQRNLTDAMPALIQAAQQSPASTNAAFKLYRNVNALYDVMSNLTESAGAFATKDEYATLARDLQQFDDERRALGDSLETATARQDAQITRMQQVVKQAQAEAAPPKKIIIDDEAAPAKKTSKKKKATAKPKSE